jgi:hypothetical protein
VKAAIAVEAQDIEDIKKMLANYKAALEDLNDGPAGGACSVHDNLVEDEKDRIGRMIKKLDILPAEGAK